MKASTITWTRSQGVYTSTDGKFVIKGDGNSNWYLYINDGSNNWDADYSDWSSNLKGAKFWAEYNNAKAGA